MLARTHVSIRLLEVDAEQTVVDHVVGDLIAVAAHLDARVEACRERRRSRVRWSPTIVDRSTVGEEPDRRSPLPPESIVTSAASLRSGSGASRRSGRRSIRPEADCRTPPSGVASTRGWRGGSSCGTAAPAPRRAPGCTGRREPPGRRVASAPSRRTSTGAACAGSSRATSRTTSAEAKGEQPCRSGDRRRSLNWATLPSPSTVGMKGLTVKAAHSCAGCDRTTRASTLKSARKTIGARIAGMSSSHHKRSRCRRAPRRGTSRRRRTG